MVYVRAGGFDPFNLRVLPVVCSDLDPHLCCGNHTPSACAEEWSAWDFELVRNEFNISIFSSVGFIALFVLVSLGGVVTSIDEQVSAYFFLRQDTLLFALSEAATYLGSVSFVLLIGILLAVLVAVRKSISAAILFVGSLLVTEALVVLVKWTTERSRPLGGFDTLSDPGFPSGHAALSVALFVLLVGFLFGRIRSRGMRIGITAVCAVIVLFVCASRVFLDVHYVSDVVAGIFLGVSVSMLTVGAHRVFPIA